MISGILMVLGIFGLLILGCFFLLYSGEKKRLNQKKHEERLKVIEQTNEQLDDVLKQMQALNPPLEKVCGQIKKFNHKFLKVK
ncbi:MAG: hypothetical protein KHX14_08095 [[Clostridium] spiroforme]|uniref:Uncharacterized protein n=1 Tax=Thomasclavelia spiroformis TaxID=29348 RepID=A0A943EPE5_9FIRM|nr:hypothetical protein [Thomasclavelia spiroformis]MBS5588753.1 hypothetical protein [Thomasclavelia spiroformis]